jgi:hypothetical protein
MRVRKEKRGVGGLIEGLRGCDILVRGRNLKDYNPFIISNLRLFFNVDRSNW